jgi:hypothetical protein
VHRPLPSSPSQIGRGPTPGDIWSWIRQELDNHIGEVERKADEATRTSYARSRRTVVNANVASGARAAQERLKGPHTVGTVCLSVNHFGLHRRELVISEAPGVMELHELG